MRAREGEDSEHKSRLEPRQIALEGYLLKPFPSRDHEAAKIGRNRE